MLPDTTSEERNHWDHVYAVKGTGEVSWFQPYPATSMEFIDYFDVPLDANIIDVGGGDSRFVDALLERGYSNVWVLDISAKAIDRARERLGKRAAMVHWVVSDITTFDPPVTFDFWHDRAAFHFLTQEDKINWYVAIAEKAIRKGGYFVLGTFSESGPQKCSGLEIRQYNEAAMSQRFSVSFDRIRCILEDHVTPSQSVQSFLFCSFRKKI